MDLVNGRNRPHSPIKPAPDTSFELLTGCWNGKLSVKRTPLNLILLANLYKNNFEIRTSDSRTTGNIMQKTSEILRLISLSILFGGSAAVVFVAIVLVKAAVAQGVPAHEAAGINAPAFIQFAKVVAGAAVMLLIAEGLGFVAIQKGLVEKTKTTFPRLGASLICAVTAFIFAFAIVPPMDEIRPLIKTDEAKAAEFKKLHDVSRGVFGATILFALISLVLPVFGATAISSKSSAV